MVAVDFGDGRVVGGRGVDLHDGVHFRVVVDVQRVKDYHGVDFGAGLHGIGPGPEISGVEGTRDHQAAHAAAAAPVGRNHREAGTVRRTAPAVVDGHQVVNVPVRCGQEVFPFLVGRGVPAGGANAVDVCKFVARPDFVIEEGVFAVLALRDVVFGGQIAQVLGHPGVTANKEVAVHHAVTRVGEREVLEIGVEEALGGAVLQALVRGGTAAEHGLEGGGAAAEAFEFDKAGGAVLGEFVERFEGVLGGTEEAADLRGPCLGGKIDFDDGAVREVHLVVDGLVAAGFVLVAVIGIDTDAAFGGSGGPVGARTVPSLLGQGAVGGGIALELHAFAEGFEVFHGRHVPAGRADSVVVAAVAGEGVVHCAVVGVLVLEGRQRRAGPGIRRRRIVNDGHDAVIVVGIGARTRREDFDQLGLEDGVEENEVFGHPNLGADLDGLVDVSVTGVDHAAHQKIATAAGAFVFEAFEIAGGIGAGQEEGEHARGRGKREERFFHCILTYTPFRESTPYNRKFIIISLE